jgi:hypothetical protein
MKTIDQVLDDQLNFIHTVAFTYYLLRLYKGNPSQFEFLFSEKIKEHYRYDECRGNPEYIWEFLTEFSEDLLYKRLKFAQKSTGLFTYIDFAAKKKKQINLHELVNCYPFNVGPDVPWEI